jgi:hypothetical protein
MSVCVRQITSGALAAAFLLPFGARADPAPKEPSVHEVTVTAKAHQEDVKRRAQSFVQHVTSPDRERSLRTWRTPVCPLVAGMTREQAEAVLARLSEIALTAGVPLAPEHCRPNVLIVASAAPDKLAAAWVAKSPRLFNGRPAEVDAFVKSARPVRVWRNANLSSPEGIALVGGAGEVLGPALQFDSYPTEHFSDPTRLQWDTVLALRSAIVILDSRKLEDLTVGQVADYVAFASLADVELDAGAGDAPSILRLFDAPSAGSEPPDGLTDWDKAYLKALYHTSQNSRLQRGEIAQRMARDVAR